MLHSCLLDIAIIGGILFGCTKKPASIFTFTFGLFGPVCVCVHCTFSIYTTRIFMLIFLFVRFPHYFCAFSPNAVAMANCQVIIVVFLWMRHLIDQLSIRSVFSTALYFWSSSSIAEEKQRWGQSVGEWVSVCVNVPKCQLAHNNHQHN